MTTTCGRQLIKIACDNTCAYTYTTPTTFFKVGSYSSKKGMYNRHNWLDILWAT